MTKILDIHEADLKYQPFPSIEEWSGIGINEKQINTYFQQDDFQNISKETLSKAYKIVRRSAAIETGAIEGLYDVDRGFTFTVASQAAMYQAVLDEKGGNIKSIIQSQLDAYEYILDFATSKVEIAEAWIRELHTQLCKEQKKYNVVTEIGIQQHELPLGEYKSLPNHVIKKDGEIHSYAPVDMTSTEMHRLCLELKKDTFINASPIIQAAYIHYAFVSIHPFADGNGRIARALASIFTYRWKSIPLLIFAENRTEYYKVLEATDNGNPKSLIDFIAERYIDAIKLLSQSIQTALSPSPNEEINQISTLYKTKGGFTHEEIDEIGNKLLEIFSKELSNKIGNYTDNTEIEAGIRHSAEPGKPSHESTRFLLDSMGSLFLNFKTKSPADASVNIRFNLELPIECKKEDIFYLEGNDKQTNFNARVDELYPEIKASMKMRLDMFIDSLIGKILRQLREQAQGQLEAKGLIKQKRSED